MSENVEIVRSIYAAWESGDFSSAEWADPAIEYAIVHEANTDAVEGAEKMSESWGDWLQAFDEFKAKLEKVIDQGDAVVVLTSFEGRGKRSGLSVTEWPGASVFTIRDRKVVRLFLYTNRAEALEAVGLSE